MVVVDQQEENPTVVTMTLLSLIDSMSCKLGLSFLSPSMGVCDVWNIYIHIYSYIL
jgi:hypothetical protein